MRRTNLHMTVVSCDIAKRIETETEIIDTEQCEEKFYTGSVPAVARAQAGEKQWRRPKVRHVRWPGQPPMADGKKVDVCPKHAHLVMTPEEYKAKKKADREAEKAAKLAEKAAAPKKQRRKKNEGAEATPF